MRLSLLHTGTVYYAPVHRASHYKERLLKCTALWTLMLMWTGSHVLEPVIVAAAGVVAAGGATT